MPPGTDAPCATAGQRSPAHQGASPLPAPDRSSAPAPAPPARTTRPSVADRSIFHQSEVGTSPSVAQAGRSTGDRGILATRDRRRRRPDVVHPRRANESRQVACTSRQASTASPPPATHARVTVPTAARPGGPQISNHRVGPTSSESRRTFIRCSCRPPGCRAATATPDGELSDGAASQSGSAHPRPSSNSSCPDLTTAVRVAVWPTACQPSRSTLQTSRPYRSRSSRAA